MSSNDASCLDDDAADDDDDDVCEVINRDNADDEVCGTAMDATAVMIMLSARRPIASAVTKRKMSSAAESKSARVMPKIAYQIKN